MSEVLSSDNPCCARWMKMMRYSFTILPAWLAQFECGDNFEPKVTLRLLAELRDRLPRPRRATSKSLPRHCTEDRAVASPIWCT